MPQRCCVPNCDSHTYSVDKVAFFQFPKDPQRRIEWMKNIKRDYPNIKRSTVVCSKHFEDKYIIKDMQLKENNGQISTLPRDRLILKKDAIPTIFFFDQQPWTPPDTNTTVNDSDLENFENSAMDRAVTLNLLESENNLLEKCLEMDGHFTTYLETSGLSLEPLTHLDPDPPEPKKRKEQSNQTNISMRSLEEDEFDLFGRSVARQLKNMTLSRALRLQLRIQALIIEDRLSVEPQQ